jgi:F-type H+-transporting ATPase subunit b
VDKLGINLGFFLFQLLNFGIIFFVLARLVWPRVIKMLDERAERIAQGLEDARAAEEARENAEREREKLLRQAQAEGQKVVEEARQRGEDQGKQVIRDARQEADQIQAQARVQAEEERNRVLGEARDQIVDLAMAAAARLIGEALDEDEKKQRAVIARFFTEVPAEAKGLGKAVTVVSAVPLTDAEKTRVKQVTGADEIDCRVEPQILGGLILRAGDKVVNGSVRGDLSSLAAQLR